MQKENAVLKLIDSASKALDEGDFKKSANFLSLAGASVDTTSSDFIYFKYHITFGSLAFSRNQIAESQKAYSEALKAARILQDTSFMVASYSGLANALLVDNKYKKALIYQNEALAMLEDDKDKTYYSLLSNMSIAYKQSQDFDNALKALLTVEEYFKKQDNQKALATIQNNIGELYRENFKDFSKAKEHYHKAIKLNKSNNDLRQLTQNYHNISLACNSLKQIDSAFYYINKALEIKTDLGDLGGLASSNHALGIFYLESNEYDAAIKAFQKSLEISEEFGIAPGLYHANIGIGDAFLAKGERIKALSYFKKVEKIVSDAESFEMKAGIAEKLFAFYKEEKDFEKALFYSEKVEEIEDSIALIKNNDNLEELRIKYETSLAENENIILREREVAQKEQIALQKTLLVVLFVALTIVLVMVVFLFKSNMAKRKAYKEVKNATDELEKQLIIVKEREAELDRSVALKNKIFSVLGHDLRTPLANVSSLIDSMSQIDLSPDEMEFMLKHLKGETSASLKTLENILQWARLQMKDKSINVSKLDEDGIIIEIIKNFESHTEAKAIEVSYVNKSKSIFNADENQFRSIANNLIANAIKFSPIKGKVDVSFVESNDVFIFTVSDEGEGIKSSVVNNLETQEELLSTYGTEGEKGTGIGLRIVKDFINLHGGTLEFSKNEPKGTIVKVSIPKLNITEDAKS
ncbi:MAG: tetratricopeptide repeat protein [Flavobacteriaceae bacterium]